MVLVLGGSQGVEAKCKGITPTYKGRILNSKGKGDHVAKTTQDIEETACMDSNRINCNKQTFGLDILISSVVSEALK